MPVSSKTVKILFDPVQPLQSWRPRIGDWIYYSGWVRHWCGFICEKTSDDSQVKIIKSTVHHDLFTMGPQRQAKNELTLDVADIKGTRCTYAIEQINDNQRIWFG